jgi:hypothetical protein
VVADKDRAREQIDHAIDAFAWFRTVADRIADVPDGLEVAAIVENGFEREQVRVNIGDHKHFQGTRASACAL